MKNIFGKRKEPSIIHQSLISAITKEGILMIKNLRAGHQLASYYQSDVRQIRKFLKSLTFPYLGEGIMRCGYDFQVLIYDVGLYPSSDKLKVCFRCKRFYVDNHGFGVGQDEFLHLLKKYCNPLEIEPIEFKDRESGRVYLKEGIDRKELLADRRWLPFWVYFEGKFRFLIKKGPDLTPQELHPRQILIETIDRIEKAFPGEKFFLRPHVIQPWNGEVEYWYYLECNESLFRKMDWVEKDGIWNPYVYFKADLHKLV